MTSRTSTPTPSTVLVTGATGRTGRRVAERLTARGVTVRAASRAGDPPFDWADPATWDDALLGADAAYIVYAAPDLAVPGAAEVVADFAARALAYGTNRLVLLSGRGEEGAQRTERLLAASGADWTVVRSSFFMQSFSESAFIEPLIAGELALPADRVSEPFVDADDIADVAVAALTEDGHAGRVYEVTGPRLLRFEEAVADIAAATGRPMSYTPIEQEQFVAALAAEGVPDDMIELLTFLFQEVLDGRNEYLADGVQEALGRPPRDFRDWAIAEAARGTWSGAAVAA